MRLAPLLAALSGSVIAQNATSSAPLTKYTIQADNIAAVYIPYGARLVSLLVPDRSGNVQDVVAGYDNTSQYPIDTATNHTYFGPVVGRYANRIKNHTFTLDGVTYDVPGNENGGLDTLHGGAVGYDQRNWTVLTSNSSSISFSLLDTSFENFPGTVLTVAVYSVSSYPSGPQGQLRPRLTAKLTSLALDHATPIMLSTHIYWNLNAFKASTILNDTYIWMPYSDRYIQTDGILIPNGTIAVTSQTAIDFTSPKLLGTAVTQTAGKNFCGTGCTGIDNAFIIDRPADIGYDSVVPVLHMWSQITGIQMDMSTNQHGIQLYTCNGQNGTIPIKPSQAQRNGNSTSAAQYVNQYGCLVIEPQQYIDGINNLQWGVQDLEIFSPDSGPAVNYATYDFSTF